MQRAVHASALALLAASTICLSYSQAQVTTENVEVDLQPCIIANGAIEKDTSGVTEAYMFSELFKGFWASAQYNLIAPGTETLDLTVDANHGRCNVVMVGVVPSADQYAQLTAYSQRFQVRIVYFDEAVTANDVPIMTKLGLGQYFASPLLNAPIIKLTAAAAPRVVNPALQTDPLTNSIFTRPMRQISPAINGTLDIVADYADSSGTSLAATEGDITYPSAAAITYRGDSGEEEMHIFFTLAWFDLGSWAWGHYIFEWGTKGVFAGERRFWLGAMVDDHFVDTNVFQYNGIDNEGDKFRVSGSDLEAFLSGTDSLNAQYNADIVTEFPLNGLGILRQVDSAYIYSFDAADAAQLPKGQAPTSNDDGTLGLAPILSPSWFSTETVDGMTAEFNSGAWDTDDLLVKSLELKDKFYWQSHTLSHLSRDNLGQSDCDTEDGGNARIAVLTGLFDSETYDWRSMTNPGITGLFNRNCLTSAVNNLMTCAPGDNTYDGVQTTVSLVSSVNQFHSIYTTEDTNGYAGFQIAPRFSSYVYFNCVTTDCLVLENLYVRRIMCGCTSVDPGIIGNLNTDTSDCTMSACPWGLQAHLNEETVFDIEANTTARWIMNGRRDKYMFHQANVVPTTVPSGTKSLLEYWYEVVMAKMATYLNLQGSEPFPLQSVKFDDLCTNFRQHEDLDASESLVTVTKTPAGGIVGMTLSATGNAGVIPVTVPSSATGVSTAGLPTGQPYKTEVYGSDITYYVATSVDDEPAAVVKPNAADLAPLTPAPVALTLAPVQATAAPTEAFSM